MLVVVGISEMKITTNPSDVLITYSLGSCVGVAVFDPSVPVGGLIHCMLPLSKIDPVKAQKSPQMFVDTGIPELLKAMFDLGATKRNLIVKVAGAAKMLDPNRTFNIGERNYIVLRKILWKNDILIAAEDVGGTIARTVSLYMDAGRTTIKSGGIETELG